MPVFPPEQTHEGTKETNRLIKFAMSLEPTEIVRATVDTSDSAPYKAVASQTDYIIDAYTASGEPKPQNLVEGLLINGVGDMRTVADNFIRRHSAFMDFETILNILKHDETTRSMAFIAAHSSGVAAAMIDDAHETFYDISSDSTHIEIFGAAAEPNPRAHCPVVWQDGEVKPWPIFSQFVPWSMELAARSLLLRSHPLPDLSVMETSAVSSTDDEAA